MIFIRCMLLFLCFPLIFICFFLRFAYDFIECSITYCKKYRCCIHFHRFYMFFFTNLHRFSYFFMHFHKILRISWIFLANIDIVGGPCRRQVSPESGAVAPGQGQAGTRAIYTRNASVRSRPAWPGQGPDKEGITIMGGGQEIMTVIPHYNILKKQFEFPGVSGMAGGP